MRKKSGLKYIEKAMVINSLYLYVRHLYRFILGKTIVGGFFNEAIAGNTSTIINQELHF